MFWVGFKSVFLWLGNHSCFPFSSAILPVFQSVLNQVKVQFFLQATIHALIWLGALAWCAVFRYSLLLISPRLILDLGKAIMSNPLLLFIGNAGNKDTVAYSSRMLHIGEGLFLAHHCEASIQIFFPITWVFFLTTCSPSYKHIKVCELLFTIWILVICLAVFKIPMNSSSRVAFCFPSLSFCFSGSYFILFYWSYLCYFSLFAHEWKFLCVRLPSMTDLVLETLSLSKAVIRKIMANGMWQKRHKCLHKSCNSCSNKLFKSCNIKQKHMIRKMRAFLCFVCICESLKEPWDVKALSW